MKKEKNGGRARTKVKKMITKFTVIFSPWPDQTCAITTLGSGTRLDGSPHWCTWLQSASTMPEQGQSHLPGNALSNLAHGRVDHIWWLTGRIGPSTVQNPPTLYVVPNSTFIPSTTTIHSIAVQKTCREPAGCGNPKLKSLLKKHHIVCKIKEPICCISHWLCLGRFSSQKRCTKCGSLF